MAVTYKKLFYLLIDRGIATAELTEQAGFTLVVYCLLFIELGQYLVAVKQVHTLAVR